MSFLSSMVYSIALFFPKKKNLKENAGLERGDKECYLCLFSIFHWKFDPYNMFGVVILHSYAKSLPHMSNPVKVLRICLNC